MTPDFPTVSRGHAMELLTEVRRLSVALQIRESAVVELDRGRSELARQIDSIRARYRGLCMFLTCCDTVGPLRLGALLERLKKSFGHEFAEEFAEYMRVSGEPLTEQELVPF